MMQAARVVNCTRCGEPFEYGCRGSRRRRCLECMREWKRQQYIDNPEPYRERAREWREKNLERARGQCCKWREAHTEQSREKSRQWRADNPGRNRAQCREWYATNGAKGREQASRWYAANLERAHHNARQWRAEHPEENRALKRMATHRRRARMRESGGSGLTVRQWRSIVKGQGLRCAYCGQHELGCGTLVVEHVLPLARGGMHDPTNIVAACAWCNRRKGTKTGDEFRTQLQRETQEQVA